MNAWTPPLANIKIASPCSANWNEMQGDDRVRFCAQCERNVYNLSALSQNEAKGLVNQTEDRLCVRFYQRKDGTILTADCPVGLKALKKKVARWANWVMIVLLGIGSWLTKQPSFQSLATALVNEMTETLLPTPVVMGAIAAPEETKQLPHLQFKQGDKTKPKASDKRKTAK